MANTLFEKEKQRKIIHNVRGNKTKIAFVLAGKSNRNYL